MNPTLKIKQLHRAATPSYQSAGASGIDLHAAKSTYIHPGQRLVIPSGIALEIPEGYEGQVRPRSGRSLKSMDVILGTIDFDYRGEVGVILVNNSMYTQLINEGERLAQLVIAPVARCEIEMVEELSDTERGAKGFGSTGT